MVSGKNNCGGRVSHLKPELLVTVHDGKDKGVALEIGDLYFLSDES